MHRTMLKSKIHRATVTQADLHYVGSVTISRDLMEAADLLPGEQVDIVDINNGARLTTYVIAGPADSGVIGINGAAARLIAPDDLVIIISYASVPDERARTLEPRIVFVDEANRIVGQGHDPAEQWGTGTVRGDEVANAVARMAVAGAAQAASAVNTAPTMTADMTAEVTAQMTAATVGSEA